MSDIAVGIVRECLSSADPGERRNAVKALGALGSTEAAEILVATSLDPTNRVLRDAAVEELIQLGDGINGEIAGLLGRGLSDPQFGKRIYALLGRLRRAGSPIKVSSLPRGRAGLRLGLSLFAELYPKGSRKPWARSLKAAVSGGLRVGAVIAVVWIALSALGWIVLDWGQATLWALALIPLWSGLATALFAPIITRRASPIALHFDSKLACASETLWAAAGTAYAAGIALLLLPASFLGVGLIAIGAVNGVVAAPVRYGCIMQHLRGRRRASRLSRVCWGTILGSLALAAIIAAALLLFDVDWKDAGVATVAAALGVLPGLAALASAYVSIDEEDAIKA